MSKIVFILLFLPVSISTIFGQTEFNYNPDFEKILERTKVENDPLFYSKLVDRFVKSDSDLTESEVLAMLIGFTHHSNYQPFENLEEQRKMYELNRLGKYQESIDVGRKFLANHPFNIKAHWEMAFSFQKLNEIDSSQHHVQMAQMILDAMKSTGDGLTKETAIFALSPNDGNDFVEAFLKAKIGTKGSDSDKKGNTLYVTQAKLPSGESVYYYFNVQHASKTTFGGRGTQKIKGKRKKKLK